MQGDGNGANINYDYFSEMNITYKNESLDQRYCMANGTNCQTSSGGIVNGSAAELNWLNVSTDVNANKYRIGDNTITDVDIFNLNGDMVFEANNFTWARNGDGNFVLDSTGWRVQGNITAASGKYVIGYKFCNTTIAGAVSFCYGNLWDGKIFNISYNDVWTAWMNGSLSGPRNLSGNTGEVSYFNSTNSIDGASYMNYSDTTGVLNLSKVNIFSDVDDPKSYSKYYWENGVFIFEG